MTLITAQGYTNGLAGSGVNYLSDINSFVKDVVKPSSSTSDSSTNTAKDKNGTGISGFLEWLRSGFSDFASRAGVVIMGFILLGIGLTMMKGAEK